MGNILFEFNYAYHLQFSFKDECNLRSQSSSTNKLAMELKKLLNISCQNLLHVQDLQIKANDNKVKS